VHDREVVNAFKISDRTIHIIIRIWTLVILLFILYHAYELGYTDKYKPGLQSDRLRLYYVNTGIAALRYLNFTNIVVGTSFLITPVVLFVLLFKPQLITASRAGVLLTSASLFFLTIFNVLAVDVPLNYYASRYFIPALLPVLFLTFCLILINIRSKWIFAVMVAILSVVIVLFSIRHDYSLYENQAHPNRYAVIKQVGNYIPPHSYVFLHVNDYLRCLLLPNLRIMDELNVISMNAEEYKEIEWAQLERDIVNNYVSELDAADFYVISNQPYNNNIIAHITFDDARTPTTIDYPRTLNRTSHNLYIYHVEGFGNQLFNDTKTLNLTKTHDLDIQGRTTSGDWSTGNIMIRQLKYQIKSSDKYIVLNTAGKYHAISQQYHIPDAMVSLAINGKTSRMIKKVEGNYYFKLDKSMSEITSIALRSSTFIPKKVGINADERVLGIDITNFTVE
jgi:hypothetical protein